MENLLLTWTCALTSLLHANGAIMGASVVYVPEEHFLFLRCGQGSNAEWTHGAMRVNITKHNPTKYQLRPDGTLYMRDLEETDSGYYYCNGQLVAEVIILTGDSFVVSEGGTLYLPCSFSGKPKQRWSYKQTTASKREFISTLYRNGTLKQERENPHSRFIHYYSHLHIVNLQLSDSGIYLCNGNNVASVTVVHTESITLPTATTESAEEGDNVHLTPENAMLVIFLVFSVLAVVIVTLLSIVLCLKSRSQRKGPGAQQEGSGLQLQKTSGGDPGRSFSDQEHSLPLTDPSEIQYASLGQRNWRARGWKQDSRQQVIYSTLLITPNNSPPNKSVTQKI